MATALHSTRTRFFDKCGKPLCGGTVHTYQFGTTTDKPTYTDVNKTAVNTNPVILDSIGSAAIFLDGAYRVRVLDRNGVLVEDIAYIESWISATEKDKIYEAIDGIDEVLTAHSRNYNNPHRVSKTQIGLGNVDNTSDMNKPISKAVSEALTTKADIADTYTKNETDNKISALSATTYAGHKGYITLAEAQAAQASLAVNTLVEVTNDSDSSKNGVYLWDGATLTKSNYDPITYMNNNVRSVLGITNGVNIADTSRAINKAYYNYQSGEVSSIDNAIFNAVGLIEIESGTKYQVPDTYTDQTAFFDSNKKFIGGIAQVDSTTHQFTTPANARYIGLTVKTTNLKSFMLAKASEYPSYYVPFYLNLPSLLVNTAQVEGFDANVLSKITELIPVVRPNIVDKTKVKNGFYANYQNGNEYALDGYVVMGAYHVEPNTDYRISSWQTDQIAFYDANNTFVGGIAQVDSTTHVFKTPENASFIKITAKPTQVNDLVLAKVEDWQGDTAEYGVQIKGLSVEKPKVTVITASPDPNSTAQFKGKNCVQLALDSITDASEQNRYVIKVARGLAKITQADEFIGYKGYPCMICPKDWVEIVGAGIGETILWAELPYDDAAIGASADGNTYLRDRYQAIYNYSGNSTISDLTIVCKNLRYTNHQDDSRGANKSRTYENVEMIFKGNKGYLKAWGCGDHSGESTTVKGGRAYSDSGDVFAIHNNTKFDKPSSWDFENYNFTSLGSKIAIEMQNDGSLLKDRFNIVGCSFGGMSYIINYVDVWLSGNTTAGNDTFDHAEWRLTGHSNEPFLFSNNTANGYALRIKSKSTGNASVVRFDKASSAFATLIKNKRVNADTNIDYKYDFVDGYLAKDGTAGLSGQALGCVDLSDAKYWYDNGVNYTSLAKRLGNLSSSAKSLKVIVDGVANTINFDKDYSAMSNTQILAEINAQLSNATADLYNYGRDYYPQMPDVSELCFNNTANYIAKGSVVAKQGGFIKLANGNDDVFGVALEDIPVIQTLADGTVKGCGLVLKRGYILTDKSKAHFVLADNQSLAVGTRFAVSNGQLVTDSNGKISIDIDAGVISINC